MKYIPVSFGATTIVVSIMLFIASLFFPVFNLSNGDSPTGLGTLLFGWMGSVALAFGEERIWGIGMFAWYANLFLVPAWLGLGLSKSRFGIIGGLTLTIVGLGLAYISVFTKKIPLNFMGSDAAVTSMGLGFYLWLSSFVICMIGYLVVLATTNFLVEESKKPPKTRLVLVLGCGAVLILCIGILVLNGLVLIRSDQRGVVISPGEPNGYRTEPLEPGIHWVKPFVESVQIYSIAPQTYIISKESNDEIEARTKDNQRVFVSVSVIYAIDPSSVIDLHATWQNRYEEYVVRPITRATVRDVISNYNTAELNEDKTVAIQKSIEDEIKQNLTDNYLILLDFTVQAIRIN